jgi:hypothetical protein
MEFATIGRGEMATVSMGQIAISSMRDQKEESERHLLHPWWLLVQRKRKSVQIRNENLLL